MRFLSFLIFVVFCIFALVARWYFVCQIRQRCYNQEELQDIRLQSLQLTDGEEVVLEGYDQFAFPKLAVAPKLNTNNEVFLEKVADYLNQNPSKELTITAFYRNSEAEETKGYFENLGIARAAQIRELLVNKGLAEERINLDYGKSQDIALKEPLLFEAYLPAEGPEGYEKVQFTFRNMTFSDANYEFDSDVFKPGTPFLLYADSVKSFLVQNPDIKLSIIGHTDNVGKEGYNKDLGMRRAVNARRYFLEKLGIDDSIISVFSEGESKPVAPNNNAENRQKNRRVNFVLQ